MLACLGCGNQNTSCYQAKLTVDAAAKSTLALYQGQQIKLPAVQQLYTDEDTARSAVHAWDAAIQSGSTNTLTTVSSTADAALLTLATDLTGVQGSSASLVATRHTGSRLLRLPPPKHPLLTFSGNKKLSPSNVLTIIQLIADLTPTLTAWVNGVFNAAPVTNSQLTATDAQLDVDLNTLHVAAYGTPAPGACANIWSVNTFPRLTGLKLFCDGNF